MADTSTLTLPSELIEFLQTDDRPTAILDVYSASKETCLGANVCFTNLAFKRLELGHSDVHLILKELADTSALGNQSNAAEPASTVFGGRLWRLRSISGKYKVLVCIEGRQDEEEIPKFAHNAGTPDSGIGLEDTDAHVNGATELPRSDMNWTQHPVSGLSPWVEHVRTFDWASTGLGPMQEWPTELRAYVLHIMTNPSPRLICWGSRMTIIYNEACIGLFSERHPDCLGHSAPESWVEIWDNIGPLLEGSYQGKTSRLERMPIPVRRNGFLEETYWDFISLPIPGLEGDVTGLFLELTETTKIVLAERRRASVMRINEHIGSVDSMEMLFSCYLHALDGAVEDVPYALLYHVSDGTPDSGSDSSSPGPSFRKCVLEGTVGISNDESGIYKTFRLSEVDDVGPGIIEPCVQAWRKRAIVTLSREDGTLPESLPSSIPNRAFGDEINTVIISPIMSLNEVSGILVVALTPRCPLDDDFKLYLHLLTEVLVRTASLISLPQEQRRAQKIADEMNTALAQQLRLITLQAERMEAKFSRMAAEAPSGIFVYDTDGRPLYVNEAYLRMLGETKESHGAWSSSTMAWSEHIHPDDLPRFHDGWQRVLDHKAPLTLEHRLAKPWTSVDKGSGEEISGETWVLANAFPDVDSDGKISSIQGWLTNISHRKFTEGLLSRKLEDALETKRQSENFIDMTTHEMRNPLSAILQSADSIVSTLDHNRRPIQNGSTILAHDVADDIVDAAQTIILCAQHQKRIIDDILTLSKLDASLLVISPDKVQPPELLHKALKMYEAEISRAGITTKVSSQ